jgi:hypothetical protein
VAQLVEALRTSRKVAGSIPDYVIFIDIILRPHYGAAVDSASNENEYQEFFSGDKRVGLTTLPPSCADCQSP